MFVIDVLPKVALGTVSSRVVCAAGPSMRLSSVACVAVPHWGEHLAKVSAIGGRAGMGSSR